MRTAVRIVFINLIYGKTWVFKEDEVWKEKMISIIFNNQTIKFRFAVWLEIV